MAQKNICRKQLARECQQRVSTPSENRNLHPGAKTVAEEKTKGDSTREFIRVLGLLQDHPMGRVRRAVEKALQVRAHSRDAVLQFLLPRFSWEKTAFFLDGRQHLRLVKVGKPDLSLYSTLLPEGGVK